MSSILRPSESFRDWLPWLLPLEPSDPEIILTGSGGLLRCARLTLPDFETATLETLQRHHEQIAATLERYGNGWLLQFDQWRQRSASYLPTCDFNGLVAAQLIDASRCRFFGNLKAPVFENHTFLAAHWQPQIKDAMLGWLLDRSDGLEQGHINYFREHTDELFGQLRHTMSGVEVLKGDALASYLSASVTYEPGKVRFPACVMSRGLATREWHLGERVQIDDLHMVSVEVRNFGRTVHPRTVDVLHALPFPARWVTSVIGLNPEQRRAEFKEVLKRWSIQQKGLGAHALEFICGLLGKPAEAKGDAEVKRAVESLDLLHAELSDRPIALASMNVHVWGASEAEANANAAFVTSALRDIGFEARPATINAAWALLGDMPGAVGKQCRESREEIPAITCLAPVTGVSDGCKTDWRFGGPALLVGLTRRASPLYWSLNAEDSDFAHTGIVGESGGGKSTLLSFMSAQFMRYSGARVILFDRGRSFLPTCLCLGGDWIELGGGGVGVQPLRAVHLPEERAWAHGWVLNALRVQGMELRPHTDSAVTEALKNVAVQPPDQRTLSMLHTFLSGDTLAQQHLKAYLAGGSYGSTFDGVVASYGGSAVVGLETQGLAGLQHVAPLATSAVLRAINRERLGGSEPKLVILDELGLTMLQNELFATEVSAWALALRKQSAVLVLATQSLSHFDSPEAQAIWDQLGNKIFMPHAEAMRSESFARYRAKGLQEEQIQMLAQAQPKGEILLQTRQVTRLINVRLEDDALAICGAIGPEHQARAFDLLRQGVQPGEEFTRTWLSESTAAWSVRSRAWRQAA